MGHAYGSVEDPRFLTNRQHRFAAAGAPHYLKLSLSAGIRLAYSNDTPSASAFFR